MAKDSGSLVYGDVLRIQAKGLTEYARHIFKEGIGCMEDGGASSF